MSLGLCGRASRKVDMSFSLCVLECLERLTCRSACVL